MRRRADRRPIGRSCAELNSASPRSWQVHLFVRKEMELEYMVFYIGIGIASSCLGINPHGNAVTNKCFHDCHTDVLGR